MNSAARTGAQVEMFKMPFRTRHFRQGQKVWVAYGTGDCAALCYGRFQGKGRYVAAWVKWGGATRPHPELKSFVVNGEFGERIAAVLERYAKERRAAN